MLAAWIGAVVLLWMSDVWRRTDKAAVTLVLSVGGLGPIAMQDAGVPEGFVYFALFLIAAVWPPTHLGLKLRRVHMVGR